MGEGEGECEGALRWASWSAREMSGYLLPAPPIMPACPITHHTSGPTTHQLSHFAVPQIKQACLRPSTRMVVARARSISGLASHI